MKIKGAAMLARSSEISASFGEERWKDFVARYSARHERFGDAFFLTSRIPIESFLEFQDALIEEFYDGEEEQYFESGRNAARWAFTAGPYLRLFEDRGDLVALLESGPSRMWENYFDFGRLAVRAGETSFEVTVEGLPSRHPYFMLTLPGYMMGAIEILGGRDPSYEEVETGEPGTVRWRFRVTEWSREGSLRG